MAIKKKMQTGGKITQGKGLSENEKLKKGITKLAPYKGTTKVEDMFKGTVSLGVSKKGTESNKSKTPMKKGGVIKKK